MSLIKGEPVIVTRREITGQNDYNEPIFTSSKDTVADVLVAPAGSKDLEAARALGYTVDLVLHFPKSYTKSLAGALVEVRGDTYEVIGDPAAYTPQNVQGKWNRPVEVFLWKG